MSLLDEIQSEAVDTKSDLGSILRKCKLLAARLENQTFQNWLIWESNGYPKDVMVPDYRTWPLDVKGHFAGWGGSQVQNAPIPLALIPEKIRKHYERYQCRMSVTAIEACLNKSTGIMQISVADLALVLGQKIYKDMNCVQAWAQCGDSRLVEVLNSVRNRIFDFTIALNKEAPGVGEQNNNKKIIKPDRVTQIFNTTIYGGSANVVGAASDSTVTFNIAPNDFASIQKVLKEHGVKDADILDLRSALESESLNGRDEGFGPKVSEWLGKMTQKAADGSWKIGLSAAGDLLARLVARYYGIGA